MSDRQFTISLLLLGVVYGVLAFTIKTPFSYDPLGPRPVPLFLSGILILLTLILFLHPQKSERFDKKTFRNRLSLFTILLFYQFIWETFGFLLSTTICLYLIAKQFYCSWMQGLMIALILSVFCYGIFHFIFKVPLPLGDIFISVKG